jgi:hypothetical protein
MSLQKHFSLIQLNPKNYAENLNFFTKKDCGYSSVYP